MRRTLRCLPVSGSQGMGNRETASDAMISRDLPFPGAGFHESASGKQKSSASVLPLVVVQRRFQPDDAACEELVDALYTLLTDPPNAEPAAVSEPVEPTCFPSAPE